MTRSSADIEREVEQTRDDLDRTVEALKDKMTPGQLLDEVTQSLKGTGAADMFGNLGSQVKENPLALAMVGAGMAWLMIGKGPSLHHGADGHAGSSGSAGGAGYRYSGPLGATTIGAQPSDPVHDYAAPADGLTTAGASGPVGDESNGGLKDKAADLAHQASSAITGAAGKVQDAASHLKDQVAGQAGHAKHGAQAVGSQALQAGQGLQRGFMDLLEQEPLIIGALGLAVGAAIGASMPSTQVEDRTFGALRDKALQEGRSRLHDGVAMAKDTAGAAIEAARDAAQEEGLIGSADGGSVVDKAQTVLRAGLEAVREGIEERREH
jgi:hypothetical protein